MRDVTRALGEWLARGGRFIGEIEIERRADGFILFHRDDVGKGGLAQFAGPEAARQLALYDDAGNFRPLKTAPNLRHGWRLAIQNLSELRVALDYFCPAMPGVWHSHERGELLPVTLRETLNRQSGMYAVTKKISDAQADAVIGSFCRSDGGCLKQILWQIAPAVRIASLPDSKFTPTAEPGGLPLLCHEACNLLVAKAREVVKADQSGPSS